MIKRKSKLAIYRECSKCETMTLKKCSKDTYKCKCGHEETITLEDIKKKQKLGK